MVFKPAYLDDNLNLFLRQAKENGTSGMYDFKNFYIRPDGVTTSQKKSDSPIKIIEHGIEREAKARVYQQMDMYAQKIQAKYDVQLRYVKKEEEQYIASLPMPVYAPTGQPIGKRPIQAQKP